MKARRAYEKPMANLSLGPLACLRNHESHFRCLSIASKGRDHAREFHRARGYAGHRAPNGLLSQTQLGRAVGTDSQRPPCPISFDRRRLAVLLRDHLRRELRSGSERPRRRFSSPGSSTDWWAPSPWATTSKPRWI